MKAYKKLQKAGIDFTLKCIRIIDFLQKENIDVIKLKKRLLLLAFFYQKVLACLQLLLLKKSSCLPPTPGLIPWRMGEEKGGGGGCGGAKARQFPWDFTDTWRRGSTEIGWYFLLPKGQELVNQCLNMYSTAIEEGKRQKKRQRASLLFWGTEFIQFLAALAFLHQNVLKKVMNLSCSFFISY